MYIIIERHELAELMQRIDAYIDVDNPATDSRKLTETATDILDYVIGQLNDGDDLLQEIICDETILDMAAKIVDSILANPVIGSNFQWLKVLDVYGSLVIRINTGERHGKLNIQ